MVRTTAHYQFGSPIRDVRVSAAWRAVALRVPAPVWHVGDVRHVLASVSQTVRLHRRSVPEIASVPRARTRLTTQRAELSLDMTHGHDGAVEGHRSGGPARCAGPSPPPGPRPLRRSRPVRTRRPGQAGRPAPTRPGTRPRPELRCPVAERPARRRVVPAPPARSGTFPPSKCSTDRPFCLPSGYVSTVEDGPRRSPFGRGLVATGRDVRPGLSAPRERRRQPRDGAFSQKPVDGVMPSRDAVAAAVASRAPAA